MPYRTGRPTRLSIKRDIRQIIRTFPSTYIFVHRLDSVFNDLGEQDQSKALVYKGEALVRPTGGSARTYGLGTVENFSLVLLINGRQNIRQGDVVTVNDGREYVVMFPPGWFDAFMEVRLEQRSQIQQTPSL